KLLPYIMSRPRHPAAGARRAHPRMRRATTGRSRRLLALVLLPALTAPACRSHGGSEAVGHEQETSRADARPYLLETVGEFAVSRPYAEGFAEMSRRGGERGSSV